jgi:L-ascorbate metabolism protein UlaG (beta-lactamase superfamily)
VSGECWVVSLPLTTGTLVGPAHPFASRSPHFAASALMRITYIGHATLLLEIAGVTILTDPNFDPRLARILPRVAPPGIALQDLPKLDAILLTHAHSDHLSFKSLDALPRHVPLIAPPAVERWLVRKGYVHAVPIAPDGDLRVGAVRVHAAAATHIGSRYGYDRWRADANMYLLDGESHTVFFAGDTALTPDTHRMVERHLHETGRALDLALLPIGHPPQWKLKSFREGHLTTDDALALFDILQAKMLVPYHWGTFRHVFSGAHDAINVFRARIPEHPRRDAIRVLEPGEALEVQ